jgi:hypothetical protein
VSSKGQEENALSSFVFNKLEYDPQVIARAARPGSFQFAFKFVGLRAGMKAVCGKQFQGRLNVLGSLWMFLENFLCSANESGGTQ